MSKLNAIIEERSKAIAFLTASGKSPDDVDNLLLLILKTLNSGCIEGEFSFKINQHTIKDPVLATRVNLRQAAQSFKDGESVIEI